MRRPLAALVVCTLAVNPVQAATPLGADTPQALVARMEKAARTQDMGEIAACLACTTLLAHASDTPAPVPVEAFYRAADIESYALSPSGKRLAVASSAGAPRTSLAVFDLVNGAEVKVAAR